MNITEKTPRNADWIATRDNSVETVLYLYNSICHRFRIDEKYGDDFVSKNQDVIIGLVNAAVSEMKNK